VSVWSVGIQAKTYKLYTMQWCTVAENYNRNKLVGDWFAR